MHLLLSVRPVPDFDFHRLGRQRRREENANTATQRPNILISAPLPAIDSTGGGLMRQSRRQAAGIEFVNSNALGVLCPHWLHDLGGSVRVAISHHLAVVHLQLWPVASR
jgi:hypothetical protein